MFIIFLISIPITIYDALVCTRNIICKPPYKCHHYFGLPGTGKTTIAADMVRTARDSNRKIFSNVPIRGANVYKLEDLGIYDFRDCDVIIDEAGVELGNRSWHSNLNQTQIDILKKYRHYHINIHLFSQTYNDYDNKFRDLINKEFFVTQSKIPFFVTANAIDKKMELIEGQFVTYYEYDKSENRKVFMPKTWAYFNSYDTRDDLLNMYSRFYTILDTQ